MGREWLWIRCLWGSDRGNWGAKLVTITGLDLVAVGRFGFWGVKKGVEKWESGRDLLPGSGVG